MPPGPVTATDRPIVIVSNRGPVSFTIDGAAQKADGTPVLRARRGSGGLVSGLGPLVAGTDVTWIAAAMGEGDRLAAARGSIVAEGFRVRTLAIEPDTYRAAYDVVCNATLWFLHHGLWDLSRRPRFDLRWRAAWEAYRSMNNTFAEVVADEAPHGAAVLVQDYHLCLLAPLLRARRPDLDLVHFSHTPFAAPDLMRVLPSAVAAELLESMDSHHACGFHTQRWSDNWTSSTTEVLGREPTARSFVSPLAPDAADLAKVASSVACADALRSIEAAVGERLFLVRVDRIELSKNLLRGFLAFDEMLGRFPEWRERVVFGAYCHPSREGLAEYLAYRQEVETVVRQVNERWATPGWTPILFETTDDFPRSVAALRRFDLLLVNPIRDGLNLVAKEGPLVNERHGLVALSPEAGAWSELSAAVRRVDPYDVSGTAEVLAEALGATDAERRTESARLRALAAARSPRDWLADQVSAATPRAGAP